MPLLKAVSYDPATLATASVGTAAVMTALDTTNLRASFTAPASGVVLVRGQVPVQQLASAAAWPRLLLGVLDGATVKLRMSPFGGLNVAAVGRSIGEEFYGIVSGLSGAKNYDLAAGVEVTDAHSQMAWGGPNDTAGADAPGAAWLEIWDPGANFLAGTSYDPASLTSLGTSSLLAMTALDTTNLRLTFTAPASGNVFWRIRVLYTGASATVPSLLVGILEGATVVARQSPRISLPQSALASSGWLLDVSGVVTGVTAGSHSWDAAYAVQAVSSAGGKLSWGGPNDTTANNAAGAALFEVWQAS